MQDAYLFDNGNRDEDWNAVWEAEVSPRRQGLVRGDPHPLFARSASSPPTDMTWGLQVYRWLHGRGEDTGWVMWDRNASGFVSRWGTLTGLRGVDNPRKLEVLPYVLTKHVDPAAEADEDQLAELPELRRRLQVRRDRQPDPERHLPARFRPGGSRPGRC